MTANFITSDKILKTRMEGKTMYLVFNEFYELITETTSRKEAECIARKSAGYIEYIPA